MSVHVGACLRRMISYIKPEKHYFLQHNRHKLKDVRNFSASAVANMKFVQFTYKNNNPSGVRVGYLEGNEVVDINKVDSSLPTTLIEILKKDGDLDRVNRLKSKKPQSVPLASDHCAEQNLTPPEVPMIFSKFASTVCDDSVPGRHIANRHPRRRGHV
ncbi:unnamed protein product [Leptidea sinapis]|uniref:Uncharacterized protein n=1 Tax=Leptidea sinapis TaxID=189913 RepID=A0A5E4R492_9NEOP|nr:unnamed protein product [Leptidea sinapis]